MKASANLFEALYKNFAFFCYSFAQKTAKMLRLTKKDRRKGRERKEQRNKEREKRQQNKGRENTKKE